MSHQIRTAEQVAKDIAALEQILENLGLLDEDGNLGPIEAARLGEILREADAKRARNAA